MPWLQAASFGVSALGHVLNRTGGRKKVKATLADTSFIDDEIETIRSRNEQMTDKFMQSSSAGVGFADNTRGRVSSAMGVGRASSMLDNARISGFEMAANAGRQNEMNTLQAITSLSGMKASLEQFNAQAQNNATATNFQANRAGMGGIFEGLSAGMLALATGRRDESRFQDMRSMQENQFNATQSMYDKYLESLKTNPNTRAPM